MNAEEFLKMKLNVSGRQYMDDWSANDVIEVMEEYAKAKAGQHETIVMCRFFTEKEMKEAYEFAQPSLLPTGHGKGWEEYKKMKGY